MLIQRASRLAGENVDIRVRDQIIEVAEALRPLPGEDVLDAAGGLVLPGLHDHHVHIRAAAAALASARAGPPQVRSAGDLAAALAAATVDEDGWIRAVGYHDSVAGPLDRRLLDRLAPAVPVRVQHRSGALWVLNSAALARVGLAEHHDGRLFRMAGLLPDRPPPLGALSERLLAFGVTGLTDATPGQSRADIEQLCAADELRQRLHCMAPPDVGAVSGVSLGPAKRILDDTTLDLDSLMQWIADCHDAGRAVAVHCVTAGQLVVTLAALRTVGVHAADRIEHAAVVPADCIADLAELGVTVVTQPNFVAERGDQYLADVPAEEIPRLWPVASLLEGGVRVALSTDVPFGDADPWAAMRAAVRRVTPSGATLGARERISAMTALTMFLGCPDDPAQPRTVAPGQPGDLCVLAAPAADALADLDADAVAATIIGGRVEYQRSVR